MDFSYVQGQIPVPSLAIQLNKSTFGITPAQQQIVFPQPLAPGGRASYALPMVCTPGMVATPPPGQPPSLAVQTAFKNMASGAVFYCTIPLAFEAVFSNEGAMDRNTFIQAWQGMGDSQETYTTVQGLPTADVDALSRKLAAANVAFVARRQQPPSDDVVYYSARTLTNLQFLIELTFRQGVPNACKLCVKTQAQGYQQLCLNAIQGLLLKP
mmetsp:Transcript_17895/g.28282  ORF Transcript_17895/g.28282 Transcript_17895/m.28282 type:complete len:212 (-) Transcript_17895:329-964(-)